MSPFWVCMYNLPFGYICDERVKAIAKVLGQFMDIEEDLININPFRRIRVLMNVTIPLKRFQMI